MEFFSFFFFFLTLYANNNIGWMDGRREVAKSASGKSGTGEGDRQEWTK